MKTKKSDVLREIQDQYELDEFFGDFMKKAFPEAVANDDTFYIKEWAQRFSTGNPMRFMDQKRAIIYNEMVIEYLVAMGGNRE